VGAAVSAVALIVVLSACCRSWLPGSAAVRVISQHAGPAGWRPRSGRRPGGAQPGAGGAQQRSPPLPPPRPCLRRAAPRPVSWLGIYCRP